MSGDETEGDEESRPRLVDVFEGSVPNDTSQDTETGA